MGVLESQGHGHQSDDYLAGEERQMPRIVITHAVQDVGRWQKGKAERAAALPGAANVTDLVAMDGIPPEMAAEAESHGVIMPMTVYVEA
jgi:hypothetical protein